MNHRRFSLSLLSLTTLILASACSSPASNPAPSPVASPVASPVPSASPSPTLKPPASSEPAVSPTPAQSPTLSPAPSTTPASPAASPGKALKVAGLPFGKDGLAAVNWQDALWLIGGKGTYGTFDTSVVQLYSLDGPHPDVANGGELPLAISAGYFKYAQSNAVASGAKLYKLANSGTGGAIRNSDLYELERKDQNWTARLVLKLPQAGAPALVAAQNRIYAIGGWEDSRADAQGQEVQQDSRAVLAIDPVSAQVSTFAQLPAANNCMWALAHEGFLYSIGGFQTQPGQSLSSPTADILKISLTTGTVEKLGQLPSGRSFGESFSCEGGGAAAAVFKGQIVIAGGYHYVQDQGQLQGRRLADVLSIDPASGRVSVLAELPSPRSGVALAVFKDKLYAIGGHDGTSALIDVLEIPVP